MQRSQKRKNINIQRDKIHYEIILLPDKSFAQNIQGSVIMAAAGTLLASERISLLAHPEANYALTISRDEGMLVKVVNSRAINGERHRGTMKERVGRVALTSSILAINGVAQASIFPMSLALGGDNKVLGYGLAIADSIDFSMLEGWAAVTVVNVLFESLSPEEDFLLRAQLSTAAKTTIFAGSFIIAILFQIPFAYEVSRYQRGIMRDLALIAVPFQAGCVTFNSLNNTFTKALTHESPSTYEIELQSLRESMIEVVEENMELFVEMDPGGKKEYIEAFNRIKELHTDIEGFRAFMKMMLESHPDDLQKNSCGDRGVDRLDKFTGYYAAGTFVAFEGLLGYLIGNALSGPVFGGVTAVVAALANTYLSGTEIPPTVHRVIMGIKNILQGNNKKSLGDQLRPKLAFSLKAISTILASLCWGPASQATADGIPPPFRIYAQVSVSMAFIFLVATPMLDVIDGIVLLIAERKGTPEEKEILSLFKGMKELIRLLKNSPFIEFARGLKALPEETFAALINRTTITTKNLELYINRKCLNSEDRVTDYAREASGEPQREYVV